MSTTQNAINNLLAYTSLSSVPANSILGNNTGSTANAIALSSSQVLDLIGSTQGDILYRGSSGWAVLAPGTSGQVLQTQGASANPQWANATSGYAPMPTTNVSGTTQSMTTNNAYVANNSSLVTLTLPSSFSVGDEMIVMGLGAGGWKIAQNASQLINFGNAVTTTGTGGSLASQNQYDVVHLKCIASNTLTVISAQGNITVT